MGSFEDFTDPIEVPYQNLGVGFGYSVTFKGPKFIPSMRMVNQDSWKRAYPYAVVGPDIPRPSKWRNPIKTLVASDGEWKNAKLAELNTNRVSMVQIWAYASNGDLAPGTCPGNYTFFDGDGGGLTLRFPYTIPMGWRLTKIRVFGAADDYWLRWSLRSENGQDFMLAVSTRELNAESFNNSTVNFVFTTFGGLDTRYLRDKNTLALPDSCGYNSLPSFSSPTLGERFPGNIDAEFPIMPHPVDRLILAKRTGENCGDCGSDCETGLRHVFLEFHSGNAITEDGGQNWNPPPIT